jgi:hypothetical protein
MKSNKKRYVFLVITAAIIIYAAYRFFSISEPRITGYENLGKLPRKKKIVLTVSSDRPVRRFYVAVVQDLRQVTVIDERNIGNEKTYELTMEPRKLGIKDGKATVYLVAESGFFSKTEIELDTGVDIVPPEIKQISSTPYVKQGSAGAVRVRAIGADKVYVKILDWKYPLLRSQEGDKNVYRSLFPVELSAAPGTDIIVVAEDDNENVTTAVLGTTITKASFRKDKIRITDDFVRLHISPLLGEEGEGLSPVEAIRRVNEVLRGEDNEVVRQLAGQTSSAFLWEKKKFLQLRNSKVFAHFGDVRNYYYEDEHVSSSTHLGYDLASVRNAPVPAANAGRVVYAGSRRLYGNTVVIDHGLGLMSLYGHLSSIGVREGQEVERGEVIGATGSTGFALGDHLHFEVIVHGVAVNPLAWWDMNWIENKIFNVFL